MGWNNNNNRGNWNNNGGNWNNNNGGNWNNNRNNNGGGYNNNRQEKKKHSGCKTKRYTPTSGPNAGVEMTHTHGWMLRKGVFSTFSANTTKKSIRQESGWMGSIAVEVVTNNQKSFYWGTMEYKTGKVVIDSLGIVMSPKGGKGGYTGSFTNN